MEIPHPSHRWQKADDGAWQAIPYSQIRRRRDSWLCSPLPQDHRPPLLTGDSYQSLTTFFSRKNHPGWAEFKDCPRSVFRATLQALGTG